MMMMMNTEMLGGSLLSAKSFYEINNLRMIITLFGLGNNNFIVVLYTKTLKKVRKKQKKVLMYVSTV